MRFGIPEEESEIYTVRNMTEIRNSIDSTSSRTTASEIFTIVLMVVAIYTTMIQKASVEEQGPFYPLQIIPKYTKYLGSLESLYQSLSVSEVNVITDSNRQPSLKPNIGFKVTQYGDFEFVKEGQQSQWIQWEDPSDLMAAGQLSDKAKIVYQAAKQGITLLWNSKSQFVQQWASNKNQIISLFQKAGFFYHQVLSLNLRSPTGKLLTIFRPVRPQISGKQHPRNPKTNFLSIHCVFRMQENLAYLREWIGYHILLGVDKFFLYDNTGTNGNLRRATSNKTKMGVGIECFGNDENITLQEFNKLWQEYGQHIVYVPWQPTNFTGKVFYGQRESLIHYAYYFVDGTQFTAQIDVDQFLFSYDGYNLQEYIQAKSYSGATAIRLMQAKFANRMCYDNKRIIEITEYYEANTVFWNPKNIVKTSAYTIGPSKVQAIHHINHNAGYQYFAPLHQLRINHYNLFKGEPKFAVHAGYSTPDTLYTTDDSMSRYFDVVANICDGKCTEHYVFQCPKQDFKCPVVGQPAVQLQ